MATEPKNAMKERSIYMPEWMLKEYLDLRHMIENDRQRTVRSGEEFRIVALSGLRHAKNCKACRAGEDCPDTVGNEETPPASVPKQALAKTRSPRSKASG